MARVTVEDCIVKVPNRFELIMLAAHRARGISSGEVINIESDGDRNPVIALREIADSALEVDTLKETLIKSMQVHAEFEDMDDEDDHPSEEEFESFNRMAIETAVEPEKRNK